MKAWDANHEAIRELPQSSLNKYPGVTQFPNVIWPLGFCKASFFFLHGFNDRNSYLLSLGYLIQKWAPGGEVRWACISSSQHSAQGLPWRRVVAHKIRPVNEQMKKLCRHHHPPTSGFLLLKSLLLLVTLGIKGTTGNHSGQCSHRVPWKRHLCWRDAQHPVFYLEWKKRLPPFWYPAPPVCHGVGGGLCSWLSSRTRDPDLSFSQPRGWFGYEQLM